MQEAKLESQKGQFFCDRWKKKARTPTLSSGGGEWRVSVLLDTSWSSGDWGGEPILLGCELRLKAV